jgi:hypothetical protein
MLNKIRILGRCFIFLFLTLLTQIGGLVYLFTLLFAKAFGFQKKLAVLMMFIIAYSVASFATINVAPTFGRQAVPCFTSDAAKLKTAHPLYCVLNRNYVTNDLALLLKKASVAVAQEFQGAQTLVLDGNFPFVTGFPLLPHLSHDDGLKADLAFYYQDGKGSYLLGYMKSPIGYWGYTQPRDGEPMPCANYNKVSLRWDFDFLQGALPQYRLEPERTAFLLNWLTNEGRQYGLEKILLEPHIKSRLNLKSDLIRFQGCRAARHDDHIHLQVGG